MPEEGNDTITVQLNASEARIIAFTLLLYMNTLTEQTPTMETLTEQLCVQQLARKMNAAIKQRKEARNASTDR